MSKVIPFVVLIIVQSVVGVQAQSVGDCLNTMLDSINAGGYLCSAAEEYIRCVLETLNLSPSSMSEIALTNMENTMEQTLAAYGIHCDINITDILRKSGGYDGATTIGDCLNTFMKESTKAGRLTCSLVTPYLKCILRVAGLCKYANISFIVSTMKTQFDNILRSAGLFCSFDIRQLCSEAASA